MSTFYFAKIDTNVILKTKRFGEHHKELKIEFVPGDGAVKNDFTPKIAYHLYDTQATAHLAGIHVVLTCDYSTTLLGEKFRLDTRPFDINNVYTSLLLWEPKDVVYAISQVELQMKHVLRGTLLFSESLDWEVQYYGLIRELARKCKV